MPTYVSTLRWLYSLQYRGMKFGLRNIRLLLRETGNPHLSFPSVHVAGTNGKGSTASFLASVFSEAGYRTGLYTSPHLLRFTERIRINGAQIPEERLVTYAQALRATVEAAHATFFEATTCIAFQYFADEKVDVAVIEAGLGGRLDATNALVPVVSIITNIGLEHTEYLGSTVQAIAREKAGIIKRGVPVVTASQDPVVLRVFSRAAARLKAPLINSTTAARATMLGTRAGGGSIVRIRSGSTTVGPVTLGLPGEHQIANAVLAVTALRIAQKRMHFRDVRVRHIIGGLRNVLRNTGLRGRMEDVRIPGARILLDVGHNPDGVHTMVESLRRRGISCPVAVFGALRDKDVLSMLRALASITDLLIAVSPGTERAHTVPEVMELAKTAGIRALAASTVAAGVRKALLAATGETASARKRILITGSHYVVGEALVYLEKNS